MSRDTDRHALGAASSRGRSCRGGANRDHRNSTPDVIFGGGLVPSLRSADG
jgi:hypothetical protein